ncbi:MAG: CBS domain-containing protein [Chlorobi bacterium]|nr:CBS domain-containing protein [Chlorobiota bacterium]
MRIGDLITDIPMVNVGTDLKDVVELATKHKVFHVPVAMNGVYGGLCNLLELIKQGRTEADVNLPVPLTDPDAELLDVLPIVYQQQLTILPIGIDKNYHGSVVVWNLLRHMAIELGIDTASSILVLEVPHRDYDLSRIVHLIEAEGSKVYGVSVRDSISSGESSSLNVIIKINTGDVRRVVASLERFGYKVTNVLFSKEMEDLYKERYESLMRYLKT